MCVGDWRLGRLIRSQVTSVAHASVSSLIALPNKDRVGILLGYSSGTISVNNSVAISVNDTLAFMIGGGKPVLMLSMRDHGDLVCQKFSAAMIGASTGQVSFTEFFLPESYLAAGLAEFNRTYMGGR